MIGRRLIVFGKVPRLGSVKTRLARDLGQIRALDFYRATLKRTLTQSDSLKGVETVLQVSPDNALRGRYFPPGHSLRPQGQGNLGERMARALASNPDEHRILIGGDIPEIQTADLQGAFAALLLNDVVFGPAEDGGFWLVGLRAGFRPRGLFRRMRWSHPGVLKDAIATLPAHATIAFVRTLNDIDDIEDYHRHRAGRG